MNRVKALKYLGNGIIESLITNKKNKNFFNLDSDDMNVFPERYKFSNTSLQFNIERYRSFYFKKGNPKIILSKTKGLILLHNSWTPMKFKNMSEKDFLNQDIRLSKLFSIILKTKKG